MSISSPDRTPGRDADSRQNMIRIERTSGGRGFRLETSQFLPVPRDRIFEFFADAFQLETLTPAWLHFCVLTPAPIHIRKETIIDYRLRLHGIPIKWQSRISVWEPPFRYVDEQVCGPYRAWYHEHLFKEVNGGTLCHDRVDYEVRGGTLINKYFVSPDVLKIFKFRQKTLDQLFPERKNH